jgi:hypothetical protein
MPSVSTITIRLTFIFSLLGFVSASAQENSPYSRYGIGDLYPSQNIVNRGFGGLTAAYTDPAGQSINFSNPASYADFKRLKGVGGVVLYDLGFSIDSRSLRSKLPLKKYSSASFIPSYISLGVPIGKGLGGAIGLRPYSRINYSIISNTRINGIDSAQYLYEGSGGLNQAFIGIGKKWGNFSVGFNTGYMFGKRQTNTRLNIVNTDTAYPPYYMKSNTETTTYFGKPFLSLGVLYDIKLRSIPLQPNKLKVDYWLRLGATAMLGQTYNASQDLLRETFEYDASGGAVTIDSVYKTTGTAVKIKTPSSYTIGAVFHKTLSAQGGSFDAWTFGAEFETSKWTQYRFNGLSDKLSDYWQVRLGGQWIPSTTSTTFFGRSTMRLGINYGRDYINADNNGLKTFSGTVGLGVSVRQRSMLSQQFTVINTALEFGKRGTNVNNVTESFFRLSVGLSLSDLWFIKRKYD